MFDESAGANMVMDRVATSIRGTCRNLPVFALGAAQCGKNLPTIVAAIGKPSALAAVDAQKGPLTAMLNSSYQAIAKAAETFLPLPEKISAIRQSPEWNAPVFILTTEAAPRASKILDLLQPRRFFRRPQGGLIRRIKGGLALQRPPVR